MQENAVGSTLDASAGQIVDAERNLELVWGMRKQTWVPVTRPAQKMAAHGHAVRVMDEFAGSTLDTLSMLSIEFAVSRRTEREIIEERIQGRERAKG